MITAGTGNSAPAEGFYCSTSEAYFSSKEALQHHYKSDFHRYNLKRKVAGLPPVTRKWFDERKEQLSSAAGSGAKRVWFDPLTRKRFGSKNTYEAHVNSKKYHDLVKKSGQPAPEPQVSFIHQTGPGSETSSAAPGTFLPASQPDEAAQAAHEEASTQSEESGWETDEGDASPGLHDATGTSSMRAEDGSAADMWEAWDPRRSLFDNHLSDSLEANLEYMWRAFHFSIPDSDFLHDAPGLLTYLAQKMRYGRMALYVPGESTNAKQFASMHAVQRHMIDRGLCRMAYDGNEEEYADFYDFEGGEPSGDWEMVPAEATDAQPATSGYEIVLPSTSESAGKVLGSREFARYYRQRHRPAADRPGVQSNALAARYRAMGVATTQPGKTLQEKQAVAAKFRQETKQRLRLGQQNNRNNHLSSNSVMWGR